MKNGYSLAAGPRPINRSLVGVTEIILLNKIIEIPSTKCQIPNKSQWPKLKIQNMQNGHQTIDTSLECLGHWNFEFGYCLEFGYWDFRPITVVVNSFNLTGVLSALTFLCHGPENRLTAWSQPTTHGIWVIKTKGGKEYTPNSSGQSYPRSDMPIGTNPLIWVDSC